MSGNIVLFTLTSFSFIIYTIFLITIIWFRNKKPFNSSFFTLCIPLGLIDLISIVNSYINHKFPDWGWYSDNFNVSSWYANVMARVGTNMVYYCGYSQSLAMLALAINRSTVFLCPIKHQQIWSQWLKWVVIGLLSIPIIPVLPQLMLVHFRYHCFNTTKGCFIVVSDWKQGRVFLNIGSVFMGSVALATGTLYVIMFYAAYKHRQNHITHNNDRLELRFGICGFITFLAMLIYCIVCACIGETTNQYYKLREALQYWYIVGDMYAWINPYLVLSCSTMVRRGFVATMLCHSQLEIQSALTSRLRTSDGNIPLESEQNWTEPRPETEESIVLLPKEVMITKC